MTPKIALVLTLAKLRNPTCKPEWVEYENGTLVKKVTLPKFKF